jgi:hypothetical protein
LPPVRRPVIIRFVHSRSFSPLWWISRTMAGAASPRHARRGSQHPSQNNRPEGSRPRPAGRRLRSRRLRSPVGCKRLTPQRARNRIDNRAWDPRPPRPLRRRCSRGLPLRRRQPCLRRRTRSRGSCRSQGRFRHSRPGGRFHHRSLCRRLCRRLHRSGAPFSSRRGPRRRPHGRRGPRHRQSSRRVRGAAVCWVGQPSC